MFSNEYNYCILVESTNVAKFEGRCYKAVDELKSWENASTHCNNLGMKLAGFESVPEYEFIRDSVIIPSACE